MIRQAKGVPGPAWTAWAGLHGLDRPAWPGPACIGLDRPALAWAGLDGLDRLILASYPGVIRLRGNKCSTKVAANQLILAENSFSVDL